MPVGNNVSFNILWSNEVIEYIYSHQEAFPQKPINSFPLLFSFMLIARRKQTKSLGKDKAIIRSLELVLSVGVHWKMAAEIVRGVIVLICRQQVDCECSK